MLPTPNTHQESNREGLNMDKFVHAVRLPFSSYLTKTSLKIDKFEDLNINQLRQRFAALILDVDGTLTAHHSQEFSQPVIRKLMEVREKMKVCIYSNNVDTRQVLQELNIPVARHVPPKPAPQGFRVIPQLYFKGIEPYRCAMVGDNYLTDGGCRLIGMHFIKVKAIPGPEKLFHRLTRTYGNQVAAFHDLFRRK